MKQRIFSRLAWFVAGSLLAMLLLEGVLRLLPVSMGLYRTNHADQWPLYNYEPHLPFAYSFGWSMLNPHRGFTNNYGHIAPFDYQKASQPVLVIGDSFIDSFMNDYADTLQGQLGQRLGKPGAVYGLGATGLSASEYVALAQMAGQEFKPAAAVVLMIDGDLSESIGQRLGHHYLVPDGASFRLAYAPLQGESLMKTVRKTIGDIWLYRYVQVHLQFSLDQVTKVFASQPTGAPAPAQPAQPGNSAKSIADQIKVADWLLAELPRALALPPQCIVFLVDADRYALYQPELASTPKDSPPARRYFLEQAQKLGFKVSDLGPVFRARYAQEPAKFDYWPFDRHWNKRGHGVGADEAARLLLPANTPTSPACL